MIDLNTKRQMLELVGHDEFWLATRNPDQISLTFYEEIGEQAMIDAIRKLGEYDWVCHIAWLRDLNNVCRLDCQGKICSDVLGAYVGEDNQLSISVFSNDDKANLFVSIYELPWGVVDAIYDQVMELKHHNTTNYDRGNYGK